MRQNKIWCREDTGIKTKDGWEAIEIEEVKGSARMAEVRVTAVTLVGADDVQVQLRTEPPLGSLSDDD